MPAASVIKLPLVMTLYADAAAGRLSLEERLGVGERVSGSGVLGHLTDIESGCTNAVEPLVARPLLGLLGLAAASVAGAEVRELPSEMGGAA